MAGGGLLRLGWAGKCPLPEQQRQESPLDRQITTPENQASRLSLIPPTPLSKGLVIDFFVLENIKNIPGLACHDVAPQGSTFMCHCSGLSISRCLAKATLS
jgi:hypothetical protein